MTASRRRNSRGFTLLELVFVMVIACIVLALAAPSLKGWSNGMGLGDSGQQFLATTRFARTSAIANSNTYRLYVDPNNARYWVMAQDGESFVNVRTSLGQVFTLPEGYRITMTDLNATPLEFIEFYPTGRMQAAHVKIIPPNLNDVTDLECPSPVEGFRILTQEAPR
jgi:prepilin-type N-terminal cleavage/methylation domain-containing protein